MKRVARVLVAWFVCQSLALPVQAQAHHEYVRASQRDITLIEQHATSAGGTLNAAGNLTIVATGVLGADGKALAGTGDLTLKGAQLSAEQGAVTLSAKHNIDLAVQTLQQGNRVESSYQGGSVLNRQSSHQLDELQSSQVIGNRITGNTVALQAGQDLTVRASSIVGSGDVSLTATAGSVQILAAQSSSTERHLSDAKQSGLFGADNGIGFTLGSRSQHSSLDGAHTLESQNRSVVGSNAGNLIITAGKDALIQGSDLIAGKSALDTEGKTGHIDIQAQNIALEPGQDTGRPRQSADSRPRRVRRALGRQGERSHHQRRRVGGQAD